MVNFLHMLRAEYTQRNCFSTRTVTWHLQEAFQEITIEEKQKQNHCPILYSFKKLKNTSLYCILLTESLCPITLVSFVYLLNFWLLRHKVKLWTNLFLNGKVIKLSLLTIKPLFLRDQYLDYLGIKEKKATLTLIHLICLK